MESEWADSDVYSLINLYELYPILYDITEVNYRNREMKKQVECEIADALNKPGMLKQLCFVVYRLPADDTQGLPAGRQNVVSDAMQTYTDSV